MRNIDWPFTSLIPWTRSRQESRTRPRHWILGITLIAALFSFGCPQQNDPLQAFNPPTTPGNPNPPGDPAPAPVPEPATALLFGAALLIGGGILRRRRNKNHK
jgi:hypothetical protein